MCMLRGTAGVRGVPTYNTFITAVSQTLIHFTAFPTPLTLFFAQDYSIAWLLKTGGKLWKLYLVTIIGECAIRILRLAPALPAAGTLSRAWGQGGTKSPSQEDGKRNGAMVPRCYRSII